MDEEKITDEAFLAKMLKIKKWAADIVTAAREIEMSLNFPPKPENITDNIVETVSENALRARIEAKLLRRGWNDRVFHEIKVWARETFSWEYITKGKDGRALKNPVKESIKSKIKTFDAYQLRGLEAILDLEG